MQDSPSDPLIVGLAACDARALEALYDRMSGRLYRAALGMLSRREDAEDAVQEVFVALVRSRRLRGVRDLEAYLFASLRHAAARCAARRARLTLASEETLRQAPSHGEHNADERPGQELERALDALPPKQREVIALKIEGELTFAQIGLVLGTSGNTAASRYRYALEKLRGILTRDCC